MQLIHPALKVNLPPFCGCFLRIHDHNDLSLSNKQPLIAHVQKDQNLKNLHSKLLGIVILEGYSCVALKSNSGMSISFLHTHRISFSSEQSVSSMVFILSQCCFNSLLKPIYLYPNSSCFTVTGMDNSL
jgi:hypothetical protein